jgi:hypothetical protein
VITTISPDNILAGSAGFTLIVNGDHFETNSVVRWFGVNRPTTFVSKNEIRATIGASDIAFAQTVQVQVVTPPPGGGSSNIVNFTINNPVPVLSSITPPVKSAGSGAFGLTLLGDNFVVGSKVTLNGVARNIVFVNKTKITATVSAAEAANPATYQVRVVNAGPGGGTSAAKTLNIVKLAPTSVAIFPGAITGSKKATAAVYMNGPAPTGGQVIALSKTGGAISVPATVTAPAGKYSAVFQINSTPVAVDTTCTVKATVNGVSAVGTVRVLAPVPISVTLNPSSINSGQSTTGTLTLSGPAPAGGLTVKMASGVPGIVHVPSPLLVAAGQTTRSFTVTTSPYGQTASIAVWALYNKKGAFALLTISP